MSLRTRKNPIEMSADWCNQTVGQRLNNCIFQLRLYDLIDDQQAAYAFDRLEKWIDERFQNE